MKTVVGLFDSTSDAQGMLQELMQMGFQADDISVVTNVASQQKVEGGDIHLDAMNLADVGSIAAGGPLRETLKRSSGTSLALRGALERAGFPADLADRYAAGVERGGTLESLVVPDSEADRVVAAMKRRSAAEERGERRMAEPREEERLSKEAATAAATREELSARERERDLERGRDRERELERERERERTMASGNGSGARTETTIKGSEEKEMRGLEADQEWRIPIVREELKVGKRALERGGVRIAVHVVQKPVTEQIHLRESHVEIERRAVDRPLTSDIPGFKDQTLEVSEEGEETVVSKQARVVEEVIVHKHVSDRIETINDSLRTTEIDFGRLREFEAARYREHFGRMGGGEYKDYEPAYRFGGELKGRWEDIEESARSRWESQSPGTWDRFKEAIRFGHGRKAND
jgi:uncharacterized protein (TIGR02271 family)